MRARIGARYNIEGSIMVKTMKAKYKGRDARTGAPIYPGDEIQYCTVTRRAWITGEPGDSKLESGRARGAYVSHVFNFNGQEYYRNKAGRCIDAPCCGCCTI